MISTDLLLKGLAGVAVVGGASGVGVWYFSREKVETLTLSDLAGKVGLNCTAASGQTEETGIECNIEEKGLSVKQGTNKEEGKKKDTAAAQTPAGKIKGYKVGNGFKFVIEEGDIALKGGAQNPTVSKLEQFETYEIKEDEGDKKQYLTRKKKSWEEKRRMLGIPEEEGCAFPESGTTPKVCLLDKEKIKKVKFDGVTGEPAVAEAAGAAGAEALSLKISITPAATEEATQFPLGYKFELQSNKDISLGGNKSIKKGTNTEFKIKKAGAGKDISLSLEKAWTVKSLGDKVGLECPETVTSGAAVECSLKDGRINVKNGAEANKKLENHSKKEGEDANKKVKVEIEKEGYNQGFKFYAEQEICLKNNGDGGQDKKIEGKGTTATPITYEILKDADKWYLTKKTTNPAG